MFPRFEKGGVVPGAVGQAVPIIAHAGETVVPAGQAPINVNIGTIVVGSQAQGEDVVRSIREEFSRNRSRYFTGV